MAVEDGQMREFTPEVMAELAKSRRGTFQKMMEELPGKGYEVVDLREEDGFMARLGIKVHEGERRGCLIICAGGGFAFKSWNEALPVAEFFYERGINVAILDYHVNRETDLRLVLLPKWQERTAYRLSDI